MAKKYEMFGDLLKRTAPERILAAADCGRYGRGGGHADSALPAVYRQVVSEIPEKGRQLFMLAVTAGKADGFPDSVCVIDIKKASEEPFGVTETRKICIPTARKELASCAVPPAVSEAEDPAPFCAAVLSEAAAFGRTEDEAEKFWAAVGTKLRQAEEEIQKAGDGADGFLSADDVFGQLREKYGLPERTEEEKENTRRQAEADTAAAHSSFSEFLRDTFG